MNAVFGTSSAASIRRNDARPTVRPKSGSRPVVRETPRTRRLAAALAAVLALGTLAGSASAGESERYPVARQEQVLPLSDAWELLLRWWREWASAEDGDDARVQGDEGGSVDPETGEPGSRRPA